MWPNCRDPLIHTGTLATQGNASLGNDLNPDNFALFYCCEYATLLQLTCNVKNGSQVFKPEFKSCSGDIQELLEQVDGWMKEISKKLDILTESRGRGTTDEGVFVHFFIFYLCYNIDRTLHAL